MKIAAILQNRNEVESGHLPRFLTWNSPIFDYLVAYDDFSSDASVKLLKDFGANVIEGQFSMFNSELNIKAVLLKRALELHPDTDWILWLDADELLLCSRPEIDLLLEESANLDFDGIRLPLVNLWRSERVFRLDSNFNDLKNVRFWKNTGEIHFNPKPGLHHLMHPDGIRKVRDYSSLRVLHFGFASDEYITKKFDTYRKSGQRGRNLWRLVDEFTLNLESLSTISNQLGSRFADWECANNLHTLESHSEKLVSQVDREFHFGGKNSTPIVTLISLIYAGVDWLAFQYGELLKLQSELGPENAEILFVANDANDEVIDFLELNQIPHVKAPGRAFDGEWYINSVYRAYNFGAACAKGEYVLLTNSDMAYYPGFLSNLLKYRSETTYLVGKLIESGRLTPASAAIKRNLGKSLRSFKRNKFYALAKSVSQESSDFGGLYMPLLINRKNFLTFNGYPEGNLRRSSLDNYIQSGNLEIASLGEDLVSGDFAFVERLKHFGWEFKTLNSAIAYHFQEGEKSEHQKTKNSKIKSGLQFRVSPNTQISRSKKSYRIPRLQIVKDLELRNINSDILVFSNDLNNFRNLTRKKISKLRAVITSSETVLRRVSIDLNIHCYLVNPEDIPTAESKLTFNAKSIIAYELAQTFIPSPEPTLQEQMRRFLPKSLKRFVLKILKLINVR